MRRKKVLAVILSLALTLGSLKASAVLGGDSIMPKAQALDSAVVETWEELKAAIDSSDNVSIVLNANIQSPGGTAYDDYIMIVGGKNVTIDLKGHELSRNLESASYNGYLFNVNGTLSVMDSLGGGSLTGANNSMYSEIDSGGCIFNTGQTNLFRVKVTGNAVCDNGFGGAVYNMGILRLSECEVTDNTAGDGGAIYNTASGTVTIDSSTVSGNTSTKHGGGGVDNYGTLNLIDTVINGNSCTNASSSNNGAGVWNGGVLNVEGKVVISGNTSAGGENNLFLKDGKVVNATAAVSPESEIYLSGENMPRKIATNWSEDYGVEMFRLNNNFTPWLYGTDVGVKAEYYDRTWDSTAKEVVSEFKACETLPRRLTASPSSGWYYVYETQTIGSRVNLSAGSTVNIILGPDGELKCSAGIYVPGGATLNIYSTRDYLGKLTATGGDDDAGIGGNEGTTVGNINIYGGTITASSSKFGAGIGGGYDSAYMGNIVIYAGKVTANSVVGGAGIGGGHYETVTSGSVVIRGGLVDAIGGSDDSISAGAGIGSGSGGDMGQNVTVTISGGTVTAESAGRGRATGGAGIGAGSDMSGGGDMAGTIRIEGGRVDAVGGGQYIYDGIENWEATGGAGIGGGYAGNVAETGKIYITGGYVTAKDEYGGAAIGGGAEADYSFFDGGECEGSVTISGGTTVLSTSGGGLYIGHGWAGDENGDLTLGQVNVHRELEDVVSRSQRESVCREKGNTKIYILSCYNHDISYSDINFVYHTASCDYCSYREIEKHVFDQDNVCTLCGYAYQGEFKEVNVHFDDDIVESTQVPLGADFTLPEFDIAAPEGKFFSRWKVYFGSDTTGEPSSYGNPGEAVAIGDDAEILPDFDTYANLRGYSVSIEGDIGVNFYMALSDNIVNSEDAYVKFTVPSGNKTSEVKVYVKDVLDTVTTIRGETVYRFKCNVAAKDIAAPVKAQLFKDEYASVEYSFSVNDYAEYLLDPENAHPDYEKAAPLVRAIVNYGAYAQKYFNITENELTPDSAAIADVDAAAINKPYDGSESLPTGVSFAGATLSMKSETTLSLYFESEDELTFSCAGMTVEADENSTYKIARIRGINATEAGETFTLSVTSAAGSGTVNYSPMTYCYNVLNGGSSNEKLINLCKAFYVYCEEAKAYAGL